MMACNKPREDGSHRIENAKIACQELGLTEPYEEVFVRIISEWETRGLGGYLQFFVKPGIRNLCRSPEDFERASQTFLPHFISIREQEDGSLQFATAIFKEIEAGRITSIQVFDYVCREACRQNEALRASAEEQRDGSQHIDCVSAVIREALAYQAHMHSGGLI